MSKSILLAFPTFAAAAALSTPTAGDFVRELRGADGAAARRRGRGGALSEDALALMDGLGRVNPSSPNPAADVDLWANDYDVRSRLPLPTPPGWDGWDAATEAAVVRLQRDEAEFEAGVLLAGDPELRGRLRVAGALSVPPARARRSVAAHRAGTGIRRRQRRGRGGVHRAGRHSAGRRLQGATRVR